MPFAAAWNSLVNLHDCPSALSQQRASRPNRRKQESRILEWVTGVEPPRWAGGNAWALPLQGTFRRPTRTKQCSFNLVYIKPAADMNFADQLWCNRQYSSVECCFVFVTMEIQKKLKSVKAQLVVCLNAPSKPQKGCFRLFVWVKVILL